MPQGQQTKLTSRGTGKMPATRFLPHPNLSINKMDADIAYRIKRALDTAPQGLNWRAFAIAMVDKYPYTPQELEGFALAVNQPNGSPATKLWNHLASRGFRVKHLIKYLDKLRWGHLLLELKPYEPIVLLAAPPEKVILYVGDSLCLSVTATGFPYPQYQWLKGNSQIPTATDDTFSITSVKCEDEGTYCCLIYNSADREQNVFTVGTGVQVRQTAQQASWPEPSHSYMEPGFSDELPVIVNDPCRNSVISVSVGEPFTLECAAVGPGPLEFRWMRNGQFLPCLTSSYTTEHAMVVDSGSYQCCVKNQFGEARSQVYQVKVIVPSNLISGLSTGPKPSRVTHKQTFSYNDASTLDIVAHPKSCAIEKGGSALFMCQAIGQPPLSYQWFKDGQPIPGETTDSLSIRQIHSYDSEGVYQCRVWNSMSELLTAGACLKIDLDNRAAGTSTTATYTATDKIALLIGNYDYISADQLRAPKTDVLVLAEIFRSMNYKVVSLLNLTLGEMEAAVAEFCNLLKGSDSGGSGVYGVFYFCGHGIEEIGQVYLVPQDAPTAYSSSHCLCAQKVLQQMQQHNPALCTMIIDSCRMMPDNPAEKKLEYYPPRSVGNSVCLFATTVGMKAYEYDNHIKEPNGVLVKHLQRHLSKHKPIEDIYRAVREDIGTDSKLATVQIPETRGNLVQHQRSLADSIQYSGQTQVFNMRTLRWKNAHLKPEDTSVYVKELGVSVDVEYQSEFSNVLSIYLTVRETGHTLDCSAWVVNLPPTLSVMEPHVTVGHSPVRTKTVILDIQKLKEPLTLTIRLRYCLPGSKQLRFHECQPIDIGRPLVAPLELWREPVGRREPTEQGDGPAYMNLGPDYENMQSHYENFPQAFLS